MVKNQNYNKRNGIDGRVQGIPSFTFKQAIQLVIGYFIIFLIGAWLIELVPSILAFPVLVLMALGMGFVVSYIQYGKKVNTKRTFWIVGSLFSVLALIVLSIYYYLNILI